MSKRRTSTSKRRPPEPNVATARVVTEALKDAERRRCRHVCCACRESDGVETRDVAEPSWWFVCVSWPGLGRHRRWGPRFRVLARSAEEARVKIWPRLAELDASRILAWRFELSIVAEYAPRPIDCEEVL